MDSLLVLTQPLSIQEHRSWRHLFLSHNVAYGEDSTSNLRSRMRPSIPLPHLRSHFLPSIGLSYGYVAKIAKGIKLQGSLRSIALPNWANNTVYYIRIELMTNRFYSYAVRAFLYKNYTIIFSWSQMSGTLDLNQASLVYKTTALTNWASARFPFNIIIIT